MKDFYAQVIFTIFHIKHTIFYLGIIFNEADPAVWPYDWIQVFLFFLLRLPETLVPSSMTWTYFRSRLIIFTYIHTYIYRYMYISIQHIIITWTTGNAWEFSTNFLYSSGSKALTSFGYSYFTMTLRSLFSQGFSMGFFIQFNIVTLILSHKTQLRWKACSLKSHLDRN